MTHEDICTLKQSKKLHSLGFSWHCHRIYNTFDVLVGDISPFYTNESWDNMPIAPTMAQAQKWLRERGIDIIVGMYELNPREYHAIVEHEQTQSFKSYEEALSAGIDIALNLLDETMKKQRMNQL